MTNETKLKTFKAFNKDWTCRDFQYKIGETYTHTGNVEACKSGFHSCQYPLDIFSYYSPCSSVFAEVESSGVISKESSDSKVASQKIMIKKELDLASLVSEAIQYTKSNCLEAGSEHATGYQAASSATGYRAASSATGYQAASSATGDRAASSATGDRAASSATGYRAASSATGDQAASLVTGAYSSAEVLNETDKPIYSTAISTGYCGKVKGTLGDALFLVERNNKHEIVNVWSGIVGKKKIKPNTWYTLKDGKPTIVENNDE